MRGFNSSWQFLDVFNVFFCVGKSCHMLVVSPPFDEVLNAMLTQENLCPCLTHQVH